jgi:hypothetical protein
MALLWRFQELEDMEVATSSSDTPEGREVIPILGMLKGVYFRLPMGPVRIQRESWLLSHFISDLILCTCCCFSRGTGAGGGGGFLHDMRMLQRRLLAKA